MNITKILIFGAAVVEIFSVQFWLKCQRFSDMFHFSLLETNLKLVEKVHNDVGYNVFLVRFFHNKLYLGSNEIVNKYLAFFDSNFQALFFSLIGMLGIVCGFWYLVTNKNRRFYKWIIFILLALPFIEVFSLPLPFFLKLGLIWLPYSLLSICGLWQFLKQSRLSRRIFVAVLIIISIWYIFVFHGDINAHFCYN
jgi:hypothetical protein